MAGFSTSSEHELQLIMAGVLTGRILLESLRVGTRLTVPDLSVTQFGREDVSSSAADTQPGVWSYLDFEAPDDRAAELADALAEALLPDGGWYANFEVGNELVVIFAHKVFRYAKGDQDVHGQAVAHALSVGVPRHQIDWGE